MKPLTIVMLTLFCSTGLYADGMLITRRDDIALRKLYRVKYHRVTVSIEDQISTTEVDQVFQNINPYPVNQIKYIFPVPKGTDLVSIDVWMDGKKIDGKIMDAKEALNVYQQYVRSKRDATLLRYTGSGAYETGVFSMKPHEEKRVRIRYREVLRKDSDTVRYLYPLNTEQFSGMALEDVSITVHISSKQKIKTIYSPTHTLDTSFKGEHSATVSWSARNQTPTKDFELYYSADDREIGASLLSYYPDTGRNGFFLLFVSPNMQQTDRALAKDVIFVIDRSGSMQTDRKIDQAKGALEFCLRSMNESDRFAIIDFSDTVSMYSNELALLTKEQKEKALSYIAGISASGSTNINEALLKALSLTREPDERLQMIIFLTDGLPTAGVTDVHQIASNIAKGNTNKVRLFNFGVGYDVNTTLLDKLARENNGLSEYIKPSENLEKRISELYTKVQSPVLSDISISFNGVEVSDILPSTVPDLFHGGQIILAGKYTGPGMGTVIVEGKEGSRKKRLEYSVRFSERGEAAHEFVERIWATRKVGDIIDRIQLYGRTDALVEELVGLSIKYGIITQYTSFLAADDAELSLNTKNLERAKGSTGRLRNDTGTAGHYQVVNKQLYQRAARPTENNWYDEEGNERAVNDVVNISGKTFFQKNKIWQDSEIANLKELDEVIEIRYFSDEFFKISAENTKLNRYLQLNQDIVIKVGDKIYKFVVGGS